jgi:hypothetical protein
MNSFDFHSFTNVLALKGQDRDSVKSCNSQESFKLLYGIGEWEMEDWVDLFMTKGVGLSLNPCGNKLVAVKDLWDLQRQRG